MKTETLEYKTLTYDDSPEAKNRIFNILLDAFKKLGQFTGEGLQQDDESQIEAINILERVAEDGFKFVETYDDEV